MKRMIGIIGGSGLARIDGLEGASPVKVKTPWGQPSDQILVGRLDGIPLAFLPRHGSGHRLAPADLPYRANIDALKRIGCTDVISLSACGSLREDYAPGDFVIVDQFIDRTHGRENSFFGAGCVAHVSLADPVCRRLGDACAAAAQGVTLHRGGTYLAMQGPQFSTRAESRLFRSWGANVIGMTNMPEARLAREAELCYASIAMITDYDSWRDGDTVNVAQVMATMGANAKAARQLLQNLPRLLGATRTSCPCGCDRALDHALMTAPTARDPALLSRLDAVAGRVLNSG